MSILRIALLVSSALITKKILTRFVGKGFDFQKTVQSLREDVEVFTNKLRDEGEEFLATTRTFLQKYNDLKQVLEEDDTEDFTLFLTRCEELLTAYESLPEGVRSITEKIDIKKKIEQMILERTTMEGLRIVGTHEPEESLDAHLATLYRGLFYLGITEETLEESERERICADLQHFHQQLNRPTDVALVKWYETIGVSQEVGLERLLLTCPEIINQDIDPTYIASVFDPQVELLERNIIEILLNR